METQEHHPHPFRPQCYMRGYQFDADAREEFVKHLTDTHGFEINRANNMEIDTILQLFGDNLIWQGEWNHIVNGITKTISQIIQPEKDKEFNYCSYPDIRHLAENYKELQSHFDRMHFNSQKYS
jgi:hypothetical protein